MIGILYRRASEDLSTAGVCLQSDGPEAPVMAKTKDAAAECALPSAGASPQIRDARNVPASSQLLLETAERAATDVEGAGAAWKNLLDAMASHPAKPACLKAADIDGLRAMSTLTDAKMCKSLAALDALAAAPRNAPDAQGGGSMHEFFGELAKGIGDLKTAYLGVYEDAMAKNSEFYKAFLAATELNKSMVSTEKEVTLTLVQEGEPLPDLSDDEIAQKIKDGSRWEKRSGPLGPIWGSTFDVYVVPTREEIIAEHKKLQLERGSGYGLLGGLKNLLQKFDPASSGDADGILVKTGDRASAEKWAKDMGLPASTVTNNTDPDAPPGEQWRVTLDLEPVRKMIDSLETMAGSALGADKIVIKLPMGEFQAWKVGFEAQALEIKNTSTAMAQKMANAQSIYENLIKVLSNTISAIMESLKSFLQN
ncbi:IpaD/SipD/SspD family type III secretion system needle tip protein [Oxalobacteraceae bacterium CAVE-383]|nr:IpaD/SipD/SspD family type III secretion system needle tip protein [Oxalobacteraceae bacterium CAVE-383]